MKVQELAAVIEKLTATTEIKLNHSHANRIAVYRAAERAGRAVTTSVKGGQLVVRLRSTQVEKFRRAAGIEILAIDEPLVSKREVELPDQPRTPDPDQPFVFWAKKLGEVVPEHILSSLGADGIRHKEETDVFVRVYNHPESARDDRRYLEARTEASETEETTNNEKGEQ